MRVFNLVIVTLVTMLMSVAVMASTSPPDIPVDYTALLVALLGDKAAVVLAAIGVIGYAWAHIRQLIPGTWLAKLPPWVVWILEVMAANKGQSENNIYTDPAFKKAGRARE